MGQLEPVVKLAKTAPVTSLIGLLCIWKVILLSLTVTSPGIGYDTSSSLLDSTSTSTNVPATSTINEVPLQLPFVFKLARWDIIHFAAVATRGRLYEQDWAWGIGHIKQLAVASQVFTPQDSDAIGGVVVSGILLSHAYHYLSAVILYLYASLLFPSRDGGGSSTAFIAAALHAISPAGLFLSAPYAEPLFSFLAFTGHYLYSHASLRHDGGHSKSSFVLTILAGFVFGIATTVRSNGLLNGLLLLPDFMSCSIDFLSGRKDAKVISRLFGLGIGGLCIAAAAFLPQYMAYAVYCNSAVERRPWCDNRIPNIYSWVQSHYWNVGFLRYWTISNIPLFLLAAPMLYILFVSAKDVLQSTSPTNHGEKPDAVGRGATSTRRRLLRQSARPQLLLALTALTTSHVQIITRLSSGCPLWYLWLARLVLQSGSSEKPDTGFSAKRIVRWMVIYCFVQGGLYASFLPPA